MVVSSFPHNNLGKDFRFNLRILMGTKINPTHKTVPLFLTITLVCSSHTTSTRSTRFTLNSHSTLPMLFTTRVATVQPLLVAVSVVFHPIQLIRMLFGGEQSTMTTITIQLT